LRVALIAPLIAPIREPNIGGAQAVVSDLARELSQRGHDVAVYAAAGSVIDGVAVVPVEVHSDALAQDVFRPGVAGAASAAMVTAYEAAYDDVAVQRYDAVHNHGFDAPAIAVAAARGVAVLHTLHLPPSRQLAAALDEARRFPGVWCAAVSQAHASAWRELTIVDAVLRNGVPLDRIPFSTSARSSAAVAARFSAEKGVAEGVAAARAARTEVDVYGIPYDPDYEHSVRARWRNDAGVHFHSPLPRPALWHALGAAAVVVCLSQWDEPFGMVAAEAQAAGTPVVASARGGLGEVVHDGVSGYLVDAGDARAAAEAITSAAKLDRRECRRHAEDLLGLAAAVNAHEELYTRIAQGEMASG
jgi:glycosyltransferase involved in cell wall biosynthesis